MYDASGNSFSAPRCKGNEPQRWSMRRRMQQRAAQPSGAAAPWDSDAHKRIAVPKALCFFQCSFDPYKNNKVHPSWPLREQRFRTAQNGPRVVIAPPSETTPVSPCEPLCARLGAGVACVPAAVPRNERCGVCAGGVEVALLPCAVSCRKRVGDACKQWSTKKTGLPPKPSEAGSVGRGDAAE